MHMNAQRPGAVAHVIVKEYHSATTTTQGRESYKTFYANTCCVFSCNKRGGRDKGILISAIVKNQGDKTNQLSAQRRDVRISTIVDGSFSLSSAIVKNQGDKTNQLSAQRRDVRISRRDWTPTNNSHKCLEHFVSSICIPFYIEAFQFA